MSLTGPKTSDYRRSAKLAMKHALPFVLTAAEDGYEPIPTDAVRRLNVRSGATNHARRGSDL